MKLIKIEKDGCTPCQKLKLELHAYKDELNEMDVMVQEINISKTPEAIEKYEVMGVPTLLLIKGGKEKWRQTGFVPGMKVLEIIKEVSEERE